MLPVAPMEIQNEGCLKSDYTCYVENEEIAAQEKKNQ